MLNLSWPISGFVWKRIIDENLVSAIQPGREVCMMCGRTLNHSSACKIHPKPVSGMLTYDSNGNEIHFKDSDGFKYWYDSNGNKITKKQFDKLNSSCAGKVVEIDGQKYQLKLV